jgi:hypothetical protein
MALSSMRKLLRKQGFTPRLVVSNDESHETLIAAIALRRKLPPANQVSAVDEEIGSGRGEAALERDCLFLADFGATAASFTPSDFDPERDRLLCADGVSDFSSASTGADIVVAAAGATSTVALRPRPSFFARVDRRSE